MDVNQIYKTSRDQRQRKGRMFIKEDSIIDEKNVPNTKEGDP